MSEESARRILPVIRDLTLSVGAGQIVAVVGASGSGKSLLAHGILGILPYNSHVEGTIRYAGELLTPERSAELRGREIALIPQGVNYLDPSDENRPSAYKREPGGEGAQANAPGARTLWAGQRNSGDVSF